MTSGGHGTLPGVKYYTQAGADVPRHIAVRRIIGVPRLTLFADPTSARRHPSATVSPGGW